MQNERTTGLLWGFNTHNQPVRLRLRFRLRLGTWTGYDSQLVKIPWHFNFSIPYSTSEQKKKVYDSDKRHEKVMAINFWGHVVLNNELLDLVKAGAGEAKEDYSRIILVSSMAIFNGDLHKVWPLTHFFHTAFLWKKSLICLEGKSMTSHWGEKTVLFRFAQQLSHLSFVPLKGALWADTVPFKVLPASLPELQRYKVLR